MKAKLLPMLPMILILLFFTGCTDLQRNVGEGGDENSSVSVNAPTKQPETTDTDIESITYTYKSAGAGTDCDFLTVRVTVFSDGRTLIARENQYVDFSDEEEMTVGEDVFRGLVEVLVSNGFFALPDDVGSISDDGAWHWLEVVYKDGTYNKGGLNPETEGFVNCYRAVLKAVFDGERIPQEVFIYDCSD